MKNLKSFTKAELISKINGLKSKQNDNNSNLFTNFMTLLLGIKSFLLKITLITIIIKIIKKYSIFRRLWTIFNTILVTIFGISMIDIFEINILSNFFHNILDYYSKFHENLLDLFGKRDKIEVPIENPSRLESINKNSTGNQENSKIIERFNKIIHKNEEIITNEPEIIEEDTPIYKNKYVIIGGLLILSGLTWYFYDDIHPIASNLWSKILEFRPGFKKDPGNNNIDSNNSSLPSTSKSNIQTITDYLHTKFIAKDDGNIPPSTGTSTSNNSIELVPLDKGKSIDLTNLTKNELERRESLQPQITGLPEITGNDYHSEFDSIMTEIRLFSNYHDSATFPKVAIQAGIYNLLRARLLKLSEIYPDNYLKSLNNSVFNSSIEYFLSLENEVLEAQSDTYDEVALATIKEQDVWSDQNNTSSNNTPETLPALLAPLNPTDNVEPIMDQKTTVFNIFKDSYKVEVKEFNSLEEVKFDKDNEVSNDLNKPLETILEQNSKEQIEENKNEGSSNSSYDHYFKKEDPNVFKEESKDIENLNIEESSKDVTKTPNIANVGLQTSIEDKLKASPLIHKKSFTNLFQDTMNLFDDDLDIDTSGETSNKVENKEEEEPIIIQKKQSMASLIKSINSQRKEYDTPIEENREISENKESSEEDEVESNINWKDIKFRIQSGKINERFINIDFGDNFNKISRMYIITNDGYGQYFDIHQVKDAKQTIKWDNKGITNPEHKDLEVFSIFLLEKGKAKMNNIFQNENKVVLDCFKDNIGKTW